MKLYIKQQLFRLTDTYDIYDESGNQKYYAKCDFTLAFHKLRVYDRNQEFGFVEQRFNLFTPKFSFYINDQYLGDILKEFTFFYPKYSIDFGNWTIDGDFFDLDYYVKDQSGKTIMHFTKAFFTLSDQYCLDIYDEQYEKICVMIALAVDMAICSQSK